MRIYLLGIIFCLLFPSLVYADGVLIDNNPTGGHRAYWPAPGSYVGGTMWTIDGDPMDILVTAVGFNEFKRTLQALYSSRCTRWITF